MIISLDLQHLEYLKLQQKILDCTVKSLKRFIKNCPKEYKDFIPKIENSTYVIKINTRYSNVYGMAYGPDKSIEYSKQLNDFSKKQIYLIVAHEIAHIVDEIIRGELCPAHDRHWKTIVEIMGGQPLATIDINKK